MVALAATVLAAVSKPGGFGLGVVILGVGLLMAGGAAISLRSIWGRAQTAEPVTRQGPIPDAPRPLRSPQVGDLSGKLRLLISFDFGCLAAVALLLIFLGLAVIFRSL
ncbi:MAG: hypothetical protein WB801_07290 [Candidatus Dormiibacterota bacterium]